jgi:hypothetical protein
MSQFYSDGDECSPNGMRFRSGTEFCIRTVPTEDQQGTVRAKGDVGMSQDSYVERALKEIGYSLKRWE